jgi:hypothetical protein
MAAIKGPNIITDGLVLALDAANVQSFKGEPTTNLVSNHIVGDYGNSPGSTNNTVSPDGSNNAIIPIPNATADRYQKTIAGGTHSSGTQFTYTWHYKQLGPHLGTAPNEPGGLWITGLINCTLVGTATKLYDLNDGWSRWKATFQIVNGSLESIFRLYFGHVIGINGNSAAYYGHQFEQKAYATPFVNGTRGTTFATGGGWADQSGTGNHGELVNGPTFSDNNFGSLVFDGINDSITIPDNSTLDLSGNKTLCCWVYMGANSSGCGIVGKSNSTVAGMALGYGWNGNGFMALAWNSTNNPFIVKDLNRDILKWNYLAAVQDGATRYIYVHDAEGMRSSSHSGGTHSWDNTQAFTIGNANNGSNLAPSNTRIAQTSIYNRALTSQEVLQNYNATRGRFGL